MKANRMIRKVFFITLLHVIAANAIYGAFPEKMYRKQNEIVRADKLVELLKSGYYISLNECTILGRFSYHDTIYEDLVIQNSTFEDVCDFSHATILKQIYFKGSKFFDSVIFDHTNIIGDIEYDYASFVSVVFNAPCLFTNIICSTVISFDSSVFKQYTKFVNSKFAGRTQFLFTKFEGYADFVNTEMTGPASFRNSFFKAEYGYQGRPFSGSFHRSKLIATSFMNAELSNVIMDPDTLSANSMSGLAFARGLRNLKFHRPDKLSMVKSYFRQNHYRQSEREITCALKRHDQNWIEKIAFDYTSEYGSNFIRPIQILLGIWLGCSFIYFLLFRIKDKSGLMITTTSFNKVGYIHVPRDISQEFISNKLLSIIGHACLFSLLSTFNIGFRGFNFARIIRLLNTKEKDFRPTGVLRTISAVQAILSVFLIGLWILSYFGRPFD